MKKTRRLVVAFFLSLPFLMFSQNSTSDVFKTVNGKNYRIGRVDIFNPILNPTVFIYKNQGGKDRRVGKVINNKVYEITRNGSLKHVMTGVYSKGKYYYYSGDILLGKSKSLDEIWKVTGENFWDGVTYKKIGQFDGAGDYKALGASYLLFYY